MHHRTEDILLLHSAGGRDAALDLNITHQLQASEHPLTLTKATAHLRRVEEAKVRKNERLCQPVGWVALPFAMHCWAGMGPGATACFQQILKRVCAALEGWARIKKAQEVRQNLAFALMKEVGSQLELTNRMQEEVDLAPPGGGDVSP